MESRSRIPVPKASLAAFCRRNGIRKLSLFGSVLRDDFSPSSDVDVLVEFMPGAKTGYRVIAMERELSDLLGGRKVDLVTEKFLNHRIRDRVLSEAEVQFAA